jgi:hypothetical protein
MDVDCREVQVSGRIINKEIYNMIKQLIKFRSNGSYLAPYNIFSVPAPTGRLFF